MQSPRGDIDEGPLSEKYDTELVTKALIGAMTTLTLNC